MSSFRNVWLDLSSDTPVIKKMVSESETVVNIPGVIWIDAPGTARDATVDRGSVLLLLDNLGFDMSTGCVVSVSPAYIALYARCMHAVGATMHPPPLGITGSELLRAIRTSPTLSGYPFGNTRRAPCRSPYHPEGRQTDTLTIDPRSPTRSLRCTACYEVELRIRRATWCCKAFILSQCSDVLAKDLTEFMDRPLTYHRLWAMLHTGDIAAGQHVTVPFAVDCPMILATTLSPKHARERLLNRAFPEECSDLRRVLGSTRLDVGRLLTRGVYQDGWHLALGMSQKMKFPHCDYWKFICRATGEPERAVVHNHYVELVRYAHTARVQLVATGIGREFGVARPDWFGPAHKMPLSQFIERIRTRPPRVIYGNVTLAVKGVEPYPGGVRVGRWFSHLWATANRAVVVFAPVGPEHMCTDFDEQAITVVNTELQRGVWNAVPANINHDLVRRIQLGDPRQHRRKRKREESGAVGPKA